jgi:transposase
MAIAETRDERATNALGSMKRGTKCRLYPSRTQMRTMDLWRRRCIQLWNLLLTLQEAAYSGENSRSRLGWRKIWTGIAENDFATAETVYREGKWRKGTKGKGGAWKKEPGWIKEPGIGREEEREQLKTRLDELPKGTPEHDEVKAALAKIAAMPKPLDPARLAKMMWAWRDIGVPLREREMRSLLGRLRKSLRSAACDHSHQHTLQWLKDRQITDKADALIDWLQAHEGPCDCAVIAKTSGVYNDLLKANQPRIFIDVHQMQKLMARLKRLGLTRWIDDLPSHAAQKTVADLDGAIQNMYRELRKQAAGLPFRKTGFAKYKPNHYAAGSVYFANTQFEFKAKQRKGKDSEVDGRIKLPNGVGWMECRLPPFVRAGLRGEGPVPKCEGARIWRRGEDWYLSVQWTVDQPEPLPLTGRTAAIKIAAKIPITWCDDRGQTGEDQLDGMDLTMPPIDDNVLALHQITARKQARAIEARKKRIQKRAAAGKRRHQQKAARGIVSKTPGRPRLPQSRGFFEAAAKLAELEGRDADLRENWLHQVTTKIVRTFDVVAVQRMQVAKMMKKPDAEEQERQRPEHQGKRRSLKAARQMMRRVAMARIQTTIKYKAEDLRGPAAYMEIAPTEQIVQRCSSCGGLNPQMKDGRQILRCINLREDGEPCGKMLRRNRNAARNEQKLLKDRHTAKAGETS